MFGGTLDLYVKSGYIGYVHLEKNAGRMHTRCELMRRWDDSYIYIHTYMRWHWLYLHTEQVLILYSNSRLKRMSAQMILKMSRCLHDCTALRNWSGVHLYTKNITGHDSMYGWDCGRWNNGNFLPGKMC